MWRWVACGGRDVPARPAAATGAIGSGKPDALAHRGDTAEPADRVDVALTGGVRAGLRRLVDRHRPPVRGESGGQCGGGDGLPDVGVRPGHDEHGRQHGHAGPPAGSRANRAASGRRGRGPHRVHGRPRGQAQPRDPVGHARRAEAADHDAPLVKVLAPRRPRRPVSRPGRTGRRPARARRPRPRRWPRRRGVEGGDALRLGRDDPARRGRRGGRGRGQRGVEDERARGVDQMLAQQRRARARRRPGPRAPWTGSRSRRRGRRRPARPRARPRGRAPRTPMPWASSTTSRASCSGTGAASAEQVRGVAEHRVDRLDDDDGPRLRRGSAAAGRARRGPRAGRSPPASGTGGRRRSATRGRARRRRSACPGRPSAVSRPMLAVYPLENTRQAG